MVFTNFLPRPALQEFVRNYTLIAFHFPANQVTPTKRRSAKPEEKIVFYLKGWVSQHNPTTGKTIIPPPVSVFTHQRDGRNIQVTPEFRALLVFLRPGVLRKLLRMPLNELPYEICDAELFFGNKIKELHNRLTEISDPTVLINQLEIFLLDHCRSSGEQTPIERIANQLLEDPVSFSLDTLAHQACLSPRQFYRKFNEQMGVGPKFFSMLSRFNLAYHHKLTRPNVSWSSVAQEFGYTDYHHLEKEFKMFAGLTPEQWVNAHLTSPERMLKLR